jgi:hypothetical protein
MGRDEVNMTVVIVNLHFHRFQFLATVTTGSEMAYRGWTDKLKGVWNRKPRRENYYKRKD